MGALRQINLTDRAHRYRAQRAIPKHPRVCVFCGSGARVNPLMVGHVDGFENHDEPANLSWVCRPCNNAAAHAFKQAGVGRRTVQFNPTKGGGAANLGEWVQAVGAITPHVYSYRNQGLASEMSIPAAVDMIRATPHSRRSSFARELRSRAKHRRENPLNPGFWERVFGPSETVYDLGAHRKELKRRAAADRRRAAEERRDRSERDREIRRRHADERRRLAERDREDRQKERDEAREEKRRQPKLSGRYGRYSIYRTVDGEYFSTLDRDSWYPSLKAVRQSIDDYKAGRNPAKFDRCVRKVKARGGAANAYAVCAPVRKKKARKNPADAAAEKYKEFHGERSKKIVTVRKKRHYHEHLPAAGELKALHVRGIDRQPHVIRKFKGAILAFNETENQLFIEGGDQSLNLADYGISKPHEIETIGKVTRVDYFTTKTHLGDEGGTAIYEHGFRMTNQDGEHVIVKIARYPDLIYRVLDEQFEFSGGSYFIRREGIDL